MNVFAWTVGGVLAAVVLVAGCSADQTNDAAAGAITKCYQASEAPLKAEQVRDAFRAAGIMLFSDTGMCGSQGAIAFGRPVAGLGNIVFDGPNENIDEHDRIQATVGNVGCSVAREAVGGSILREYRTDGGGLFFVVANISCAVHGDGDAASRQETAVRNVVRRLAREAGATG